MCVASDGGSPHSRFLSLPSALAMWLPRKEKRKRKRKRDHASFDVVTLSHLSILFIGTYRLSLSRIS